MTEPLAHRPDPPEAGYEARELLRRLDRTRYPELDGLSREAIYGHGDNMAPGGLFLAARMLRSAELAAGSLILDVAAGRGDSSVFLARRLDALVLSFDLWIDAAYVRDKVAAQGLRGRVVPLNLDATRELPFPTDYFDGLFCMQALHSFGTDPVTLERLVRLVRPGGVLMIGGTTFSHEPGPDGLAEVYRRTAGWDAEYESYHSPGWWREHLLGTGMLDVLECTELSDGPILWEDEILQHGQRAGWTEEWHRRAAWLVEQVLYGRTHEPYLTHFVATARRCDS